jgi:HlyD family secretion protein
MRKWVIILIILLIIAVGAGFYIQSQGGFDDFSGVGDAEPTPLPAIQTTPDLIVDGVVVPIRHVGLSFSAAGMVAEVLVEEGETVEAGQVLARLDNERQAIAIAQAEARIRSVRARIDELQAGARPEEIDAAEALVEISRANLNSLLEGPRAQEIASAEAGLAAAEANLQQTLAGADESELTVALAELQNAEAVLRQAQSAYDQVSWRADVGALPQSAELERASNNYEAAQARYNQIAAGARENQIAAARAEVQQARANLDRTLAPAGQSDIAAAEADLRRAEAELALRRAGARPETLAAAEADLTEAAAALMQRQVELADTELRAPFDGVIAALDLVAGEQIAAGTPQIQLADVNTWRVETDDLTELNVIHVYENQRVTVSIDALPDEEFTGTVLRIRPLGESRQGDITYVATIALDSTDSRLRWNMTASVVFPRDDSAED